MTDRTRASFMTGQQQDAMGRLPRTHQNCKENTGICRPGKTAHERWRKNQGRT